MQQDTKPKIILTGGHLAPMLSVYEALKHKAEVVIVGRKYTFEADKTISLEYNIFKNRNVKFYNLPAGRLQRKISRFTLPSLIKVPRSLIVARSIIKKEKPDAVLTFGGYVGLPVSIAAKSAGVPVVLHEQTQMAGLTSRTIAKFAKKVCISYPSSERFFPQGKTVITGNPIRPEVFELKKKIKLPNGPILYVTGGSTGAHRINEYVEFLLPKLLSEFVVLHQTGDAQEYKDYDRLKKLRDALEPKLKDKYIIKKFIMPDEIGWVFKNADVVLGRAGANTVSELIALRKKALLIPLKYGQNNEQLENAKYYESTGLGTYITEDDIDFERILKILNELKDKNNKSTEVRTKDAASEIVSVLLSTIK